MKIAFISRWFFEENARTQGRGGPEQQRVKVYQELGHEVIVLSQSENSGHLEEISINGIRVVTTPRWKRKPALAILDKLAKPLTKHRKVFSDARDLRLFLKRYGPFDVLEAQCEEPDGLVVDVASIFAKLPPWCVQLFALRYRFSHRKPVFTQTGSLGFVFRRANLVKANSDLVAEDIEVHYFCPEAKIVVVPPNFEPPELPAERLQHGSHEKKVLCVAAITETKGVREFVEAARILAQEHPEIRFSLVGGKTGTAQYDQEVKTLAASLGDRFQWLGELPRMALHEAILASDLVAIPSLFDGWNRAALESVALGRPVVISEQCGAAPWVKKSGSGLVVAAGDAENLAEGIREVLDDPTFAEHAFQASKLAREEFSAENIALRNIEVLKSLLPK